MNVPYYTIDRGKKQVLWIFSSENLQYKVIEVKPYRCVGNREISEQRYLHIG